MPSSTENVTVRMPAELTQKLEQIAASLERSRNWVINQAIASYLDVYDWQTAQIAARLEQAESGAALVPHEEVMQGLEAKIRAGLNR